MKTIAVIAIVCYLFVATESFPSHSPELDTCSTKHHLSKDRARQLAIHSVQATDDNEKCFLSCYLKEGEYLVDGRVDFDKLLENHKKFQPTLFEELKKTFDECKKNMDYNGKNECEVAYQAYSCAFTRP
uniref:Putative heme-binding protein n=1 Tax=Rhodnius prolixus TaxID=13249 RepID=R4FPG0_RHOPR